jgi:4'-phosphopantetheinyl transferase EntD
MHPTTSASTAASTHHGLAALLPPGTYCVEVTGDRESAELDPAELIAVAGSGEARRAEFATGRSCAREALAALGFPSQAVPMGPAGDPLWPAGVVGSITHCPGYRAAVVGPATVCIALGVDAEPHAALPAQVLATVATEAEIAAVLGLPPDGTAWDRVLFSAKEAAFKAWFPLTRRHLEPTAIAVTLDPSGTFAAVIDGFPLPGRWAAAGLVLTAVAVTAAASVAPPASRRSIGNMRTTAMAFMANRLTVRAAPGHPCGAGMNRSGVALPTGS